MLRLRSARMKNQFLGVFSMPLAGLEMLLFENTQELFLLFFAIIDVYTLNVLTLKFYNNE